MKYKKLFLRLFLGLMLFVSGCSIESVNEHNEKLSDEAAERQSALDKLLASDETDSDYMLIHVKITCENVVGNDDLTTSAEIPADGIFLDTDIAVKTGDSAYDALKNALADKGVSLDETDGYIFGICGLKAGECGEYSGWLYSVNGESPMVSCQDYTLSDKDSVLWNYITEW